MRWGVDLYVALAHHPVYNKNHEVVTSAVTNLDIHDIARASRTFGVRRYFVCTPVGEQQGLVRDLVGYWTGGLGRHRHVRRGEALELVEVVPDIEAAVERAASLSGQRPLTVATSARSASAVVTYRELRARLVAPGAAEAGRPVLVIFGTGWGLADEAVTACDVRLPPIRSEPGEDGPGWNHLSVRSAVAIILDRLRGEREDARDEER